MSKFKLLMLTGLVVVLAACGGQAPAATPTAVKTAVPTAAKVVPPAPPTATKASPTAVAIAPTKPSTPAAPPKLDPAGACKASAGLPKVPSFSATLPTDQSKGSDQAPAVLYEYSDFQ